MNGSSARMREAEKKSVAQSATESIRQGRIPILKGSIALPLPQAPPNEPTSQFRWVHWLVAAVLALLFHLVLLFPKLPFSFSPTALAPPRVDIQQVDPKKLEAIRNKWRHQRELGLLLDKNKNAPSEKEAPKNARYMSDRNIRVEKEQLAKNGTVLKPGAPGSETQPQSRKSEPHKQVAPRNHKIPSLGNLGVPLPAAPKEPTPAAMEHQRVGENGGEQKIQDKDLPEGSENMLNAEQSVYYSFYARLYETIEPIWQSKIRDAGRTRRVQPGDYSTNLDVVFDKQGNLVTINMQASSGIDEFDQAAIQAWKMIGRAPNPPAGLLNAEGQIHTGWNFTFRISQGLNLESLPPERVY